MRTRPVPKLASKQPVTAFYNALKEQHAQYGTERAAWARNEKEMTASLCQVALSAYQLHGYQDALPPPARAALASIEKALRDSGIEIRDYVGQPVDERLGERVRIEGWEDGEEPVERVKECFMPEISRRGEILQMAQVICARAAGKAAGEESVPRGNPGPAAETDGATEDPAREDLREIPGIIQQARSLLARAKQLYKAKDGGKSHGDEN